MRVAVIGAPDAYADWIAPAVADVITLDDVGEPYDLIHLFVLSAQDLQIAFPRLRTAIFQDGSIWISWPKKSARVSTDLDENVVRAVGLATGLVDVKVAAVDAVWSALKFVIRIRDRRS